MSKSKYTNKAANLHQMLEELVQQANEICQFSKRNSKLNEVRFVQVLVLGWLSEAEASLNELAQIAGELGYEITGSALNERLGESAIKLLRTVLLGALHQSTTYQRIPVEILEQFSRVLVTDSTQINLPQILYELFAGANQDAKAKLQVTLDYLTGDWLALEVEAGKTSDQKSELPIGQAIADSLNLFDLGYFKQERLQAIDAQNAYFVSRLKLNTALFDPEIGESCDLVDILKALTGDTIDMQVLLGGRVRLPVRLVAVRLPEAAAAARRRRAKKSAGDHGQTCSASTLYLVGWDILITNLSSKQASLAQLFDLYEIRIQIEWTFRVWKSQLRLNHLGNWRKERVLCQFYAHLIGILICHRLTAGWLWRQEHEHSFAKCVQLVQKKIVELLRIIARQWHGLKAWFNRLEKAFAKFGRKSKRKKAPSTLQKLMEGGLS